MDTAIGVTILSFVLPAAQCDLEMDSTAKGWLTASPMLGEIFKKPVLSTSLSTLDLFSPLKNVQLSRAAARLSQPPFFLSRTP